MDVITYDIPTTELAKISFKVSSILNKVWSFINHENIQSNYEYALVQLLELIRVLDRPDLRGRYYQEFINTHRYYTKLGSTNNTCPQKLDSLLNSLSSQLKTIKTLPSKLSQPLLENPFFQSLSKDLSEKQGDWSNNPGYLLWEKSAPLSKLSDLEGWCGYFNAIKQLVEFHKLLLISSCPFVERQAKGGFFQENLENRCQLVRVRLPEEKNIFPKTMVGHHGVSVQFYAMENINIKATRIETFLSFEIAYCFTY